MKLNRILSVILSTSIQSVACKNFNSRKSGIISLIPAFTVTCSASMTEREFLSKMAGFARAEERERQEQERKRAREIENMNEQERERKYQERERERERERQRMRDERQKWAQI